MNTYKLCITIPTYNREDYLKRLLDSIITQEGFCEEISIVINDGPSKDNTTHIVQEYQKVHKNIFYSRNEKAVGMLPAILESIDMSNGEYTWLFGSDDFMHQDALHTVMSIIKNNKPTLILSNRFTFHNIQECSQYISPSSKIQYFNGFNDFGTYLGLPEENKYNDKWNYLTFMSVFCFQTSYYQDMIEYTTRNICSMDELKKHYFNYIVILYAQLFSDRTICIIEEPCLVFCQGGNTSRKPNAKINTDIKMLIKYLQNTYTLSIGCNKIFRRMYMNSLIFGNIIYKLQNTFLLGYIIKYLMRNKKIVSLYHKMIKLITGNK